MQTMTEAAMQMMEDLSRRRKHAEFLIRKAERERIVKILKGMLKAGEENQNDQCYDGGLLEGWNAAVKELKRRITITIEPE